MTRAQAEAAGRSRRLANRRRVFLALHDGGPGATSTEIARLVRMTERTVYSHLRSLVADGLARTENSKTVARLNLKWWSC